MSAARTSSRNDPRGWSPIRSVFAAATFLGLGLWLAALLGFGTLIFPPPLYGGWLSFGLTYGLISLGVIGWTADIYRGTAPGIKNHGTSHRAVQRGTWAGWIILVLLGAFYFAYYGDTYLHGGPHYLAPASRLLDPLSELIRGEGKGAHYWFLYGYLYTLFVILFGIRMFFRFRHSRHQILRTSSVMAVQLGLAFLIPYILEALNQPVFYPSYFWPLQPGYLYPEGYAELTTHENSVYGLLVVSILAGAVGTTVYPVSGNRVWCRFFCPMAAILGIIQRYASRFRITTNGGQCMSCGNCSTYCEMGIDVRSYAQRGANVVRASCVGCGMCSAVCPRGVLNLENGRTHKDRFPGADRPFRELLRSLRHK